MKLRLLSNSVNPGNGYLEHALPMFEKISENRKNAVFLPFAGVTIDWDSYAAKVQAALDPVGIKVTSIHTVADPIAAIQNADLIMGGGGNTFRLLHSIRTQKLLEPIKQAVASGTPYIGWSAGSNLACPTIRTTNDMPIIDPLGFDALNLVPFQINPHYNNELPAGHQGETRSERLQEFLAINTEVTVFAIPEGTWIEVDGNAASLCGKKSGLIFKHQQPIQEVAPGDISFLFGH